MQREVVEKTLNINKKKIFFNEIISLMNVLSKKNCTVKDVKSLLNKKINFYLKEHLELV